MLVAFAARYMAWTSARKMEGGVGGLRVEDGGAGRRGEMGEDGGAGRRGVMGEDEGAGRRGLMGGR